MKRTPNNGGEKRDAVFRFRVTAAEKELIRQHAAQQGLSVSKYLRKKVDDYHSGLDRHTVIRLLAETGKQGSNLNQIAKVLNIETKTGEPARIDAGFVNRTLSEIARLTSELMEIIKHGHRRKNTE